MTIASTSSGTGCGTHDKPARVWLLAAVAVAAVVPLSYSFLDRPIATLAHDDLPLWHRTFDALTHIIDPFPAIAGLVLLWTIVVVARRQAIGPVLNALARTSAGLCVAILVNDQLKYAFGRTWPETWVNRNPSWFGDHTYGFFPFHGGLGWFAFPSGHTTVICAVAASLWVLWPRGRLLYAIAVALVVIGLIGADYHWLSDIIAGGALGSAVGAAAARIGRSSRAISQETCR
jgi:membrane-associated phospholipid phosphatase